MVFVPLTSASHNVLTSCITIFNFAGFFGNFTLAKGLLCINILVMSYQQQKKKFRNATISVQFLGKKDSCLSSDKTTKSRVKYMNRQQ